VGGPTAVLLAAGVLLAACTDQHSEDPVGRGAAPPSTGGSSAARSSSGVAESTTLICANSIDGSAPPDDYTVVHDAVALPGSPRYAALQAAPTQGLPELFAKTGLVVRAGVAAEIDVLDSMGPRVGIGWGNGPAVPSRHFVVPACPDLEGTGWLAYPGGYWADAPLCLPLDVRVGDAVQRVEIGIGTACPGQAPPPVP
jgi:hypothetical protein